MAIEPLEVLVGIPRFLMVPKTSNQGGADMFGSSLYSESPLLAQFRRLEEDLDEVFGSATPWTGGIRSLPPGTFPAINVGSTEDNVTVYLFAPGIDAKKLNISIQQNLLTVSGEREVARDDDATYYRQERFGGEFRRVISLPDDVDPDNVEASYRDGIVQITVRRRESAKPRQIAIR
jgi:HSP20 family protein